MAVYLLLANRSVSITEDDVLCLNNCEWKLLDRDCRETLLLIKGPRVGRHAAMVDAQGSISDQMTLLTEMSNIIDLRPRRKTKEGRYT